MKLNDGERERWERHAGKRADPYRDHPTEEIAVDDHGRLHVDSTVGCGVYVVLDPDDHVVYVGKVDRETGHIGYRFRNHHAAQDDWDRVWILPFREDCDPATLEMSMIKHFLPQDNRLGVPS